MSFRDSLLLDNPGAIEFAQLDVPDPNGFPSTANFPKKFSSLNLWREAVTSKAYYDLRDKNNDHMLHWEWAIHQYIHLCDAHGVFPWKTSAQLSQTDVAIYLFTVARRHIGALFKSVGFFKRVKMFSTTREYVITNKSLALQIKVFLMPIENPLKFRDWMLTAFPKGPLFRTTNKPMHLTKKLYTGNDCSVNIDFDIVYWKRPCLIVNIELHRPISLPFHGKPLTKAYLVNYIEETIWKPLMRLHRFDTQSWRLF